MKFHPKKREGIAKTYLEKQIFQIDIFINNCLIVKFLAHYCCNFSQQDTEIGKAIIRAHKHMS